VEIIIHRGATQIGGSVTEYRYNGWRLFVDFGEQLPGTPVYVQLDMEGLTKGDLSKSAMLITHYLYFHIMRLSDLKQDL
jgi:ribonuclease J